MTLKSIRHAIPHPVWYARAKLGKAPASNEETTERFLADWPSGPNGRGKLFSFSWGAVEYLDRGLMYGQFRDIFLRKLYGFRPTSGSPQIMDCGGNIGLSAIWFKQAYPDSKVTVYEADPAIAAVLERNLERMKLQNVVLRKKAVWIAEEKLKFDSSGDDRGRLSREGGVEVDAIDITKELPERVDLLKLDIEGAEYKVLNHLCQNGSIDRVHAIVAEFHVWRDSVDEMLAALRQLRTAGFEISFSAEPCPWIGNAPDLAPFPVIGDFQMLMMVYAWRRGAGNGSR